MIDLIARDLYIDHLQYIDHQMITTVYRPPNAHSEFFESLEKFIKAIDDENKEMYILGDLNCDMLKTNNDLNLPTNKIKSLYELYQLSQLIKQATRITINDN